MRAGQGDDVCWTAPQRAVLVAGVAAMALFVVIGLLRNPAEVSDPQPARAVHADELADRLDPNTADVASLAALPMIGPERAREIARWRSQYLSQHPGAVPFQRPEDLLRINGIGASTLTSLRPYLVFPTTRPTTAAGDSASYR